MSEIERLWGEIAGLRRRVAELECQERIGSASVADDANKLRGLVPAASGADAHVLATDASGSARIDGDLSLDGQLVQDDRCIRMLISKAVSDAVATGILTITTPSAGTVSGYWSLKLHVLAFANLTGGANMTARGNLVQLVHLNKSDGTPYTTAVVEVAETDSVSSWLAGRNISGLTITTTHTSNTVTTVQATVTVDGSIGSDLPGVLVMAELLWSNYSPAPAMAVA